MAKSFSAATRRARPEYGDGLVDPFFEARGLAGNGLGGIDLKVYAGEILGIYGLVGSGRSRFLRTVYGAESAPETGMFLWGKPFRPTLPEQSIAHGVAFLSEERKSDGFIPQMTSIENVILPVLGRFLSAGLLKWGALRRAAACALAGIPIRGDVREPITSLSGGNQQKALFARAVLQSPDLLLLDEPTKGVDVGAKAEIYAIIRDLARQGRSVLVVSSEEEELLEIADRVVVFRNGACDGKAIPEADLNVANLRRHAWPHAT
jgi:ABC-type sugar transport system ATPase subunit